MFITGAVCPVGAIGMTAVFADMLKAKTSQISGTYSGNSFTMAIVKSVLEYVTPERQASLEAISSSMCAR